VSVIIPGGIAGKPDRYLGVAEIAERLKIRPQTWTAYVHRGQAPKAARRNPETGRREWLESAIEAFEAGRLGQGARSDLRKEAG